MYFWKTVGSLENAFRIIACTVRFYRVGDWPTLRSSPSSLFDLVTQYSSTHYYKVRISLTEAWNIKDSYAIHKIETWDWNVTFCCNKEEFSWRCSVNEATSSEFINFASVKRNVKTGFLLTRNFLVSATREKISSAACPTPGCKGIGHVKGAKYSTHHSTLGCPYSLQNLNKESCLVDRLSNNSMTEESDWSYASKQKLAVVKAIKGKTLL